MQLAIVNILAMSCITVTMLFSNFFCTNYKSCVFCFLNEPSCGVTIGLSSMSLQNVCIGAADCKRIALLLALLLGVH